jgi:hypothetical protein
MSTSAGIVLCEIGGLCAMAVAGECFFRRTTQDRWIAVGAVATALLCFALVYVLQ